MAYALFNSGAAAAYANSFRQRNPYGGFEDIKSDVGTEVLGKIPFLNFKAELDMAKAGLKEFGAATRQKSHDDATVEITKMKLDDQGSTSKKAALARLMGGSGSMAKRTGGLSSASLLSQVQRSDPMAALVQYTNQNSAIDADYYGRQAGGRAALTAALENLPKGQAPSGRPLTVQPGTTPVLETPEGPNLKGATREDFLKYLELNPQVSTPPTPETPGTIK